MGGRVFILTGINSLLSPDVIQDVILRRTEKAMDGRCHNRRSPGLFVAVVVKFVI